MSLAIPIEVQTVMTQTWDEIRPIYNRLIAQELTPNNINQWMSDWSHISKTLDEVGRRLRVANTIDTTDQEAEAKWFDFLENIIPHLRTAENTLSKKLVESGLIPDGMETPLRDIRAEFEIFREENLPLKTQEQKLGSEYNKIIGAQTIEWEGEEKTLLQMNTYLLNPDRNIRARTWQMMAERQLQDRAAINANWVKLLGVRHQIARNAGFNSYREYTWKARNRHDYTPEDCFRFHEAIEQVVVPAASIIYERQRQALGVETLRPWDDTNVDPSGRPSLQPFQNVEEMVSKANAILGNIDPQFGDYFQTMRAETLLDLENRKGKAPGGYCTSFDIAGRPFIFMNAVGVHRDVDTLLHEAGHAFHVFEIAHLPYQYQQFHPMEFAEVASMSMELLAAPYLEESFGGYYSREDAARARIQHLEKIITFWPYMAVVDAFQHWVYENIEAAKDPANCDAVWGQEWQRFMQGIDYSGYEDAMVTGWHRKQHIHRAPFYYVEYGLAQLGAVQVWRNALQDQAAAVQAYRRGLSLGNCAPLPELYKATGAKFAFDAETLGQGVDLVMQTIDDLRQQLH